MTEDHTATSPFGDPFSEVTIDKEGQGAAPSSPRTAAPRVASGEEKKDRERKGAVQPRFKAAVTDPERKGDLVSGYVSYKVTSAHESGGKETQSSVYRRFSDFAWLHDALLAKFPAILIPPLPEKATLGRLGDQFMQERKRDAFLAERRRGLELFLKRLAIQPELAEAEEVALFLTGDEVALAAAKQGKAEVKAGSVASPTEKGAAAGLMSFLKESVQWASSSFVAAKERPKTESDLECERIAAYADALDLHLTAVHTNSDLLIARAQELRDLWFAFGLASTKLGSYESGNKQEALGGVFAQLGNCADRLSVLLTEKAEAETIDFREQLKDQIRLVGAVKLMLGKRAAALLAHQNAQAYLEGRQAKLTAVEGKPGKEAAAATAQQQVTEAQAAVDGAQAELEKVTNGLVSEVARFRAEMQDDVKAIVHKFVNLQIEHSVKVQRAWEEILQNLDKT